MASLQKTHNVYGEIQRETLDIWIDDHFMNYTLLFRNRIL